MSGGLATGYRLHTKQDFVGVFASGTKIILGPWVLRYKLTAAPHPRLGVIVGKRCVASACARNYLKRLVRWSFSYQKCRFAGVDLVVIFNQKSCNSTRFCKSNSRALQRELDNLWHGCYRALSLPC